MDNITIQTKKVKEGFIGEKRIVLPPNVKRKVTNNKLTKNLYLTAIGYYPNAIFHDMERKAGCGQYILLYCVEGEGHILVNGQAYALTPNTYFIIPKHAPHRYYSAPNNPWTIYWLHFCGDHDNDLFRRSLQQGAPCVHDIPYEESRIRLFEQIYGLLERSDEDRELEIMNLNLLHFISSLIYYRQSNPVANSEDTVSNSIAFMKKHLRSQFSIAELAHQQRISVSHYSRIFKQRTGQSPSHYFNQLKIQQSCQYLYFTDKTVKEICVALGFEDPFYFSRLFSKLMGISPSHYRKTHKK